MLFAVGQAFSMFAVSSTLRDEMHASVAVKPFIILIRRVLLWGPERLFSLPSPGAKYGLSRRLWEISALRSRGRRKLLFSLDHFYVNHCLWCHVLRKHLCFSSLRFYGCLLYELRVHTLQLKMASCEADAKLALEGERRVQSLSATKETWVVTMCRFSGCLKCVEGCTTQVCDIHYTVLRRERVMNTKGWGAAGGEANLCDGEWHHSEISSSRW